MPLREVIHAHGGFAGYSSISLPSDTGILTAASLTIAVNQALIANRGPAQYYGALYLSSIDTINPTPAILLAQGRFGSYTSVSWFGSIKREPGQVLIGIIGGFTDTIITLRSLSEP